MSKKSENPAKATLLQIYVSNTFCIEFYKVLGTF